MLQPKPAWYSGSPCPDCSFSHFLGLMPILASSQDPKSVDLFHAPTIEFVITLSLQPWSSGGMPTGDSWELDLTVVWLSDRSEE